MRSAFALSFLAAAGLAAAQEQYNIDPNSVPKSLRQYWCQQNIASCPLICIQQQGVDSTTTLANDCDSDALTYECICENNASPNMTQYVQTVPFFICQEWGNQCVKGCGGVQSCQADCTQKHPCGAKDPYKGNATVSSILADASKTMASKTADSTSVPTSGFAGGPSENNNGNNDEDSKDSKGAAPALLNLGQSCGLAVIVGGLLAGFAML